MVKSLSSEPSVSEQDWRSAAQEFAAGRSLVVIGLNQNQTAAFASLSGLGGQVVGSLAVTPGGGMTSSALGSRLNITSATPSILDHTVRGFAQALSTSACGARNFLDKVDPTRSALVVSYLPVPYSVLNGRETTSPDSALTMHLESKSVAKDLLDLAVPALPSLRLDAQAAEDWWETATAQLGSDRLVVQDAGLSSGGSATYICSRAEQVPALDEVLVAPYATGRPCSVMGIVSAGSTLVLPAARQIIAVDDKNRPSYQGNITGEAWSEESRAGIEAEVKAVGGVLAKQGFVGPFGLDFIELTPKDRRYIDLNPRIIGLAVSFAQLLWPRTETPPMAAMLTAGSWGSEAREELGRAIHEAAIRRPLARVWLTSTARATGPPRELPRAGTLYLDPNQPQLLSAAATSTSFPVLWQPLASENSTLNVGDLAVLGSLYCDPPVIDSLIKKFGLNDWMSKLTESLESVLRTQP
ncbi:ATP-grasp domain [Actinobacteria bacterium IMCC26207]|nr:ATP-grasp domain [Actinobacteria bacterium IMCC26207]